MVPQGFRKPLFQGAESVSKSELPMSSQEPYEKLIHTQAFNTCAWDTEKTRGDHSGAVTHMHSHAMTFQSVWLSHLGTVVS